MKIFAVLLASLISSNVFAGGSMGGGNPSYVKTIEIAASDFQEMLTEIFSGHGSQYFVSDDGGILKPQQVDLCKKTIVLKTQDGELVLVHQEPERDDHF